ncbi:MAG: bifunctional phosphopantothenoylcysteine decarboxylase/phosphopantothenate--cysteine ligase CoaBC [Chloroflexota bacterium]|nr:bifunctional phosphopantothenoylcysteine decarboxylase/phosphopantothenate--cysteine ligase CoaBC [Chloroflexota bacterium]
MAETNILDNKRIVLGVTGSIACYKSIDLASKLTQAGAEVDVILTRSAQEFISALTFRSLTHRRVITDLFDEESEDPVEHIALAKKADILVVAPATANVLAKMKYGFADDALTATILATNSPILVAPAMESNMWQNDATQENIATLIKRGIKFIGPAEGHLASGGSGYGRLESIDTIMNGISNILEQPTDLKEKHIIISAGGTQEPIDAVRVITNRSSGKQGYALASAAVSRGARVTLITAPTSLPDPPGAKVVHINTAREMLKGVTAAIKDAGDALIMAAAVADWESDKQSKVKLKKIAGENTMSLSLKQTPDILKAVSTEKIIKIGFAAETENLINNATEKLNEKDLDMIIANDVSSTDSGFSVDNNRVVILDKKGTQTELPLLTKLEVADHIMDRLSELL